MASLLAIGRALPAGWVETTEHLLNTSLPTAAMPTTAAQWQQHLQYWDSTQRQVDVEELLHKCRHHPNLAHYYPSAAAQPGKYDINHMVHNHSINDEAAIIISRLLCGGQGLNAGDPVRPTEVCMR